MRYLVSGFLLGILMLGGTGFAQESGKPFVTIGTGGITGVYYAAGHAIGKVFSRTDEGQSFRIDPEASRGSIDNIEKVLSGELNYGIGQGNLLYKLQQGEGPWKGTPHTNLRAVAALYTEALTIAVAEDANINSIADLKGKDISVGLPGSAEEDDALNILKLFGLEPTYQTSEEGAPKVPQNGVILVSDAAIDAAEMLQKGFIDAYFYTVGHPNMSTREATFGDRKIKLLEVKPEMIAELTSLRPYLRAIDIPVNYYPALGNKEPVHTLGVSAILFTLDTTPDEQVAAILQALLDEYPRFQRQHPAFIATSPNELSQGTLIPLHPAAEAIYRKEGLLK